MAKETHIKTDKKTVGGWRAWELPSMMIRPVGWYKVFRQEGWDTLAHDGWQGGQSRLTPDQETKQSAWLEGRFCRSAGAIRAFITAEFELGYSH